MKLISIWLSILFCLCSATVGFPQPDGEQQAVEELLFFEEYEEIIVTTASKKEQKISDAPATIYVVTQKMIANRGYSNLAELLEDIPEIEIQFKAVTEYSNYYTIRGLAGNENFIVLLDGFRINSPTGTPNVIGTNYSLANVKQVEVILGPASALYGADAFTGIINIITTSGDEIKGGKLSASYGRFSTTDNSFTYGHSIKGVSFALSGNTYYSDEPFFPDFYKDEYKWYIEHYLTNGEMILSPFVPDTLIVDENPRAYETPTKSSFLSTRLNADDFEFGYSRNSETHNTSVGTKPEFNIYAKDALYKIILESLYGKHNFSSSDKKWHLQSSIWKGSYTLTSESAFINTFTTYNTGYKYAVATNTKAEEQISFIPDNNTSIILGVTYEDISALPKTGDLPFQFDENQAGETQDLYYLGTDIANADGDSLIVFQKFYYLNYKNYGFYGQVQNELMKVIEATVGARYDYSTRYGSTFNPRLGLTFSHGKKFKAKLLYGESFLAPSPYETYQHYGSFIPQTNEDGEIIGLVGPFWHLPNPDLMPEKLRSGEASILWYITDQIQFSINSYYNKVEDLIVFQGEPNTTFQGIPVNFSERPENSGEATTYGGTLRLNTYFKIKDFTIYPDFAYTYSDGDLENKQLTYSAQHTIKMGLEMSYKNLTLSTRMIHRSESYHQLYQRDQSELYRNDPFTLINMFAQYRIVNKERLKTSVFIKVRNLLDARYYNVSLTTEEGLAATPQDPLRINGGVILQF